MTTLAVPTLSDPDLIAALSAALDADPDLTHALATMCAAFDVRVLSVRNDPDPWAGLIGAGFKPTENRTVRTNHVGPILIHSSAYEAPRNAVRRIPVGAYDIPQRLLLRGHILALANLTGCHFAAEGCCAPWGEPEAWHWQISGVHALPDPIPAKGRLGLWRPDRDLLTAALRQLREAADA